MQLIRSLKHLAAPGWWARRAFRAADLRAITEAVRQSESQHRGEIRIAIEGPLPWRHLHRDSDCRVRASELFATLGVANTREASGILIYVQLVDRRVEILADKGIAAKVEEHAWRDICHRLEAAFATGDYRGGMIDAVGRITGLLAEHFPATGNNPNELADAPTLL